MHPARPQPEARKPPSVPQLLAPLGPYPELAHAVPADCASPHVLAASAPLKMLERSDWFWPWVVQALLAHDQQARPPWSARPIQRIKRMTRVRVLDLLGGFAEAALFAVVDVAGF